MSAIRTRLKELRALMSKAGVDAYYVPSTDPHQSEYVPACWQRRQWLSGFTGSAGDMLITARMAGLWTDGRYFIQAAQELEGSSIKLFKQEVKGVPTIPQFVGKALGPGQVLGVDPRLLSRTMASALEDALALAGAKLKLIGGNLVDRIWRDQPLASTAPVEVLPRRYAGETVANKLRRLRREMSDRKAGAHVLTTLDAIAWLFNIRSRDVEYNPVAIAYAVVTKDRAVLFTDPKKVSDRVRGALAPAVEIEPYDAIGRWLDRLRKDGACVWLDGKTANTWVLRKLGRCDRVDEPSPISLMKARKNATEISGSRAAHLRDGVAMVRFLRWLEQAVPGGKVTEISAGQRLAELRAEGELFRGESFGAIVGYDEHGAIIHYQASEETASTLRARGMLLVDSGGQYLDGTTDITRTVLLGARATAAQKEHFTRVLKGHIALARCRFPAGTAGRLIDVLARRALWDVGLNYNHGTGHGVGAYLSVHEGPQSISPVRCTGVPLEVGNILSNEPGYYLEGKYGIRIENLVLVQEDEKHSAKDSLFLEFETLTLCPIDLNLVKPNLLSAAERGWLNRYHARVRKALTPHLGPAEARWLRGATKKI